MSDFFSIYKFYNTVELHDKENNLGFVKEFKLLLITVNLSKKYKIKHFTYLNVIE